MWEVESDDRPRERLLRHGPRRMSDVELVALVLRSGRRGQSSLDIARVLLGTQRDLAGLAVARADVLADFAGVGPAKAAAVAAAFELGRRTTEVAEAVPIRRAEDVVAVARRESRGVRRDELLLFVADYANRVRWTVRVAAGRVTRAADAVTAVVRAVRAHAADGFAIARVSAEPIAVSTPLDDEVVRRLRVAATALDVRFLDYVVVADTDWCGVVAAPPLEVEEVPLLPRPQRNAGGAARASP